MTVVLEVPMLLPIPDEILEAQARDRMLDLLLSSVGVSVAVASASFAAYMVVTAPMHAGAARSTPLIAMTAAPSHPARRIATVDTGPETGAAGSDGVDFDPTGSIPGLADEGASRGEPRAVLPDFAVRDVFDGTALVEANGTLQMVRPGSVLAGAGTVRSIVRQGHGWVVTTSGGLIRQRR